MDFSIQYDVAALSMESLGGQLLQRGLEGGVGQLCHLRGLAMVYHSFAERTPPELFQVSEVDLWPGKAVSMVAEQRLPGSEDWVGYARNNAVWICRLRGIAGCGEGRRRWAVSCLKLTGLPPTFAVSGSPIG